LPEIEAAALKASVKDRRPLLDASWTLKIKQQT